MAFLSHLLDAEKVVCVPYSSYQLYAVRQVCGALSLALYYVSLRWENLLGLYAGQRLKAE